jgi:23S rRNA (pseudouridine1915-N3)-methyltransferase
MLKFRFIVTGKFKESYLSAMHDEYVKRLGPYAKMRLVELREERFRVRHAKEEILKKEARQMLALIQPEDYVVVLHERGNEFTSVAFAKKLKEIGQAGQEITFVIGGPLGLDTTVLKRANLQLSLSAMTFPHQVARTLLMEQLYRAITIMKGKQYHY